MKRMQSQLGPIATSEQHGQGHSNVTYPGWRKRGIVRTFPVCWDMPAQNMLQHARLKPQARGDQVSHRSV